MNRRAARILIIFAVLVFAIGIYLIAREPDGDGRPYAPILPIGSFATILIVILARRRRNRREEEAKRNGRKF